MRNYKRLLWIAFFTGICIAALRAAVPQAWDIHLDRMPVTPRVMQGFRGETIDLQPRFLDRGRPLTLATDATVRLWIRGEDGTWYAGHDTNGALHADTGRVSVNWLPADDDGQTNVAFRVGVEDSGRSYRAFGTLTWIDAPGASPAGTLIPLGTLDWSTFDNSNTDMAPFVRKADFTLNALDDVDTTGVTNGMVMVYNAATEEWLPAAIADPIARALAPTWDGGTNGLVAATGRASLGLGTAAQSNATAFATAAQGGLADSAVQPGDLGTAAYEAVAAFATAAQGILAASAWQPTDNMDDALLTDPVRATMTLAGFTGAHVDGTYSASTNIDARVSWVGPGSTNSVYWSAAASKWLIGPIGGAHYYSTDDPTYPDKAASYAAFGAGAGGTVTAPTRYLSAVAALTDTAYGWGNHADAGYLTVESDTLDDVLSRSGDAPTRSMTVGDTTVAGDLSATNVTVHADMAISGNATGIYPTAATQFATKQYVDNVSALLETWYMLASDSSDIAGYYTLDMHNTTATLQTITSASTTNNHYVAAFATEPNYPAVTEIRAGTYRVHFWAAKGAAGAATLAPELYILQPDGTVVAEVESGDATAALATTPTAYDVSIIVPTNFPVAVTNRIAVKIKATVTSGTPTIYAYTEGERPAYVNASASAGAFLPITGGTLTGALTGTDASFTGAVSGSAGGPLVVPGISSTGTVSAAVATIPALNVGKIWDEAGTTEIYDTADGSMDERFCDTMYWPGTTATTMNSNAVHTLTRMAVRRGSTNLFWMTGFIAVPTNNVPAASVTNLIMQVANTSFDGGTSSSYVSIPLLQSDISYSTGSHVIRIDRAITNSINESVYGKGQRTMRLYNAGLDMPTGGAITNVQGYIIIYSK